MHLITYKAEKEGAEPMTRQEGSHRSLDWIAKHIRGLSSKQAYDLKQNLKIEYEEFGWKVSISIQQDAFIGKYVQAKDGEPLPTNP
jgi:hypothetical protein